MSNCDGLAELQATLRKNEKDSEFASLIMEEIRTHKAHCPACGGSLVHG